jgi:hypothetical protein
MAQKYFFCDAGFLSRLLAESTTQRFSRLSVFHHAGRNIHTNECTKWNEERYEHLQSLLVGMMDDIKSNIKVWLDDCLLHKKTEDDLLATLNFFFKPRQKYGLKLHASKCVLFATTVRYCGRFITKDGVRFDPKNMEAMQTMGETQNGVDLVQYVAAVNWMRSAIHNYLKRAAPLKVAPAKVLEVKAAGQRKLQPQCHC